MARSLDDDAPSRMRAAEERISQAMTEGIREQEPGSEVAPDEEPEEQSRWEAAMREAEGLDVYRDLAKAERELGRAQSVARVRTVALSVAAFSLLASVGWTAWIWETPARFIGPDIGFAIVIALCLGGVKADKRRRGPQESTAELEDRLDLTRGSARIVSALRGTSLDLQRGLYREDAADVIEQHRTDSRKYRHVHNTLQNFIMIGSAATTTVAALDTGGKLTWQNVTIVAIGFAVTLSAAFTGYYKYRERSYFLLQTADSIEEEVNAFNLGIGPYSNYDQDRPQALKLFTQRVEEHRNEQRRRQQQLDQPADQAVPSSQPPAA
ncbi:DUF4231 domain-containing protein [Streptomyces sp. NPDC048462]|uniref:DUF4231 domain-containing protein n=1 Tax=Streptomyces sp. NPDC048462 TaxID=3365555 RepID=UPI0037152E9B